MDQDNAITTASNIQSLGGKSWTAYIGTAIVALILLVVVAVAWVGHFIAGLVMLALSAAVVACKYLSVKSHHLYMDDTGVWISSGILPWTKGVTGVKWRDLDEAIFYQSMFSWMFKSYSIRIGHRFTKSNEIFLSHWNNGHKAVTTINAQHKELVKANALN